MIDDDDFAKKLNDHLAGSDKEKKKSRSNVFGSEDELNSSREENVRSRVPSGGGMWIPTGQDSIVDGVKEAINKLGGREKSDKQRTQSGSEKKTLPTEAKDNC